MLIRILLAKYLNNHLSSAFRHTFSIRNSHPSLALTSWKTILYLATHIELIFLHSSTRSSIRIHWQNLCVSLSAIFAGKPNHHQQNNTTNKLYLEREAKKKAAYKFIWKTYIYLFIFVVSSDEINTQEINLQVFFFFREYLGCFFSLHMHLGSLFLKH